jgi:hypothetical protein
MSYKENKVNITFWDKAVQAYQASEISLPAFCSKHNIQQDEFERWLKLFAYTSKDAEDKRVMKETRWQFQPVRIKEDLSSPTGLAFNGRDTICELIFKNGRRLFFDSSISEAALHKLVSVLELKK